MPGRPANKDSSKPNIFSLLKPYSLFVTILIIFTIIGNAANLFIPRIIGHGIDSFTSGNYVLKTALFQFAGAALLIFLFSFLQSVLQVYTSEKVARDLRSKLSDKISRQSYAFIQKAGPSVLLTNLTSDMDSVKQFVSQAVATIVSSLFIIVGVSVFLFSINWKLAIWVVSIIPIIGFTFFIILRKVRTLFKMSREVIDWLNKVINESILGSAIIRVINSQQQEYQKFIQASTQAKDLGISILTLFATLIPLITFVSNMATLAVLAMGGHFVIQGNMSLGDFAAFNSYITMLIFPILMIGFMSNLIAQATASYERVNNVLTAEDTSDKGKVTNEISGNVDVKGVSVIYNDKPALKNVTLSIKAGSQVAIIGPTAAGKTQLLYLLTGLIKPTSGSIEFDGQDISQFDKSYFHSRIGFVFQDSIMFNMSLRENINFSENVSKEALEKAIETAELADFIDTLPDKLDTIVSERGTSLSGGQKQRIMLARALALDPRILLLDDFTARVDRKTEKKIVCNLMNNYPDLTLISVTQKIAPVKNYDQIILLMEGELVARGKHKDLLESSPEYIQIYNSQKSTSHYEL
ncbi:MAG: ABC transporter ATP-binding protein [Bacteroidales bacterium]|nr:ABC transporter ATP-binding protein [Bacteroidales bacterium]